MKQMLTRERIFELYYVLQNGIPADVKLDKRFDFARNRTLDNLRPENFKKYMMTFWERLYLAWEVFQCRAEAFKWPEGQ